jgi:hypothetical protein
MVRNRASGKHLWQGSSRRALEEAGNMARIPWRGDQSYAGSIRWRYAYRLTSKGNKTALLFVLFHKCIGRPLANILFNSPSATELKPATRIETAHRKADQSIEHVLQLIAAWIVRKILSRWRVSGHRGTRLEGDAGVGKAFMAISARNEEKADKRIKELVRCLESIQVKGEVSGVRPEPSVTG